MVRSINNRHFKIGEHVAVRDYRVGCEKWTSGVIRGKTGPVSYKVEIEPGVFWCRHTGQICAYSENIPISRSIIPIDIPVTGAINTDTVPELVPESHSRVTSPSSKPTETEASAPCRPQESSSS
ncbi:hypothetical protein DPMN_162971 [Dreissena polymorpha]|uniref:Uncharacterized protein n=1 Tax=Dreissena polymorpha TaxID=45954 RepID=A0A9D4EQC5_DREPO|nr:hypothetical protein DPMN_162971 [Dreissena polymorpha]